MGKTIELICPVCGKTFNRLLKKYQYNSKRNNDKPQTCSRSCANRSKTNELSSFRVHLHNAKKRIRKRQLRTCQNDFGKECEYDLTLEYLKELWDVQEGKCVYTGWKLINVKNTTAKNRLPVAPNRASLDRIDSSQGYVKGNVQFVCYMANICKNIFTSTQLRHFAECVTEYSNTDVD